MSTRWHMKIKIPLHKKTILQIKEWKDEKLDIQMKYGNFAIENYNKN